MCYMLFDNLLELTIRNDSLGAAKKSLPRPGQLAPHRISLELPAPPTDLFYFAYFAVHR